MYTQAPDALSTALGRSRRSGALIVAVFILITACCASFLPVSDTVSIRAFMHDPGASVEIRTPYPASLHAIHVKNGAQVETGQIIADLDVSRLRLEEDDARRRLVLHQLEALRLERQLSDQSELAPSPELNAEIEALGMHQALTMQRRQLGVQLSQADNTPSHVDMQRSDRLTQLLPLIQGELHRLASIRLDMQAARIKSPVSGVVRMQKALFAALVLPRHTQLMTILPDATSNMVTIEVAQSDEHVLHPGMTVELAMSDSSRVSGQHIQASVVEVLSAPAERSPSTETIRAVLELTDQAAMDAYAEPGQSSNLRQGMPISINIKQRPKPFIARLSQLFRSTSAIAPID